MAASRGFPAASGRYLLASDLPVRCTQTGARNALLHQTQKEERILPDLSTTSGQIQEQVSVAPLSMPACAVSTADRQRMGASTEQFSLGGIDDDLSEFQTPNDVLFEEDAPATMPPEQLRSVNQRWEEFYHRKKAWLRHFCWGDEDLVSIGLLSVRKTLEQHPHCPESWLV